MRRVSDFPRDLKSHKERIGPKKVSWMGNEILHVLHSNKLYQWPIWGVSLDTVDHSIKECSAGFISFPIQFCGDDEVPYTSVDQSFRQRRDIVSRGKVQIQEDVVNVGT